MKEKLQSLLIEKANEDFSVLEPAKNEGVTSLKKIGPAGKYPVRQNKCDHQY
jgi:hypothetical protein